MTPLLCDDPCLLFAMRRESAPLLRVLRPHLPFPGAPCWARFCGPAGLAVLVVETGIGQPSVARALDWLLARPLIDRVPYRPRLILFAGFAGALTDSLQVGDLLLADEVLDEQGQCWRTTWPTQAQALDGRWTAPWQRGRLLSMDRMIADPTDKRRLGQRFEAQAVEMESALFADRCTQAGIPFGCMRAISDALTTPLSPGLAALLAGGRVSPWRLSAALARHPGMVPELVRLARATRCAAQQLGLALGELLTLTLPCKE